MSDDHDWFAPKRYGYGAGASDQLAGLGADRSAMSSLIASLRPCSCAYTWIG